jgi:calcineurin-like phosphoesterase family protein
MIYFTSDQHFGHTNIIKYTSRPFSSVEEMDEQLIENYNKVVSKDDVVYHLGDFAFNKTPDEIASIFSRLNGRKRVLLGNHDNIIYFNSPVNNKLNTGIVDVTPGHLEVSFRAVLGKDVLPVTLFHFPMLSWNKSFHGSYHLHGHTHGSIPFDLKVRRLDVGVDCNNYTPISLEQVHAKLQSIPTYKSLELNSTSSGKATEI